MLQKTDICVTLDCEGNFRRAEESELRIMIPCTEDSASRTVAINPHPLHEQLGYLALDEKKRNAYCRQLDAWSARHIKVEAVRRYTTGATILDDLRRHNITVDVDECDENGERKPEKKLKEENAKIIRLFVRFSVEAPILRLICGKTLPWLTCGKSIAIRLKLRNICCVMLQG